MTARIVFERHYRATLADVWALWTTPAGIESWWGPDGFAVTVTALDLRPGGVFAYLMTAVRQQEIDFMQTAGMPVSTPARVTYSEVTPMTRLAYATRVDFAPGVAPYDLTTEVDLTPTEDGVRMVLTFDPMHEPGWTHQMTQGWTEQLAKLHNVLSAPG